MLDNLRIRTALKLLPGKARNVPPDHIEVVPWMNKYSMYPSVGLTPERITSINKQADLGYTREQTDLYEEMLEKDLYLFGLINQRIQSVARRQYQIVPANESAEAKKRMEFAKDAVGEIREFRQAIRDVFAAIGYGVSYQQINWKVDGNGAYIDSFEWTHGRNFRWGKASDPNDNLRIPRRYTFSNLVDGVELEPYKWLVSVMRARSGHPARAALLRTCAWMWFFKNIDIKSWVIFCEIYGIPLRLGTYNVTASEEDKAVIRRAVQQLGVDASAVISELTKIDIKEAAQKSSGAEIFEKLKQTCNSEYSVGVLGHESAAAGTPGKLGKEDMAEDVRFDLVESDAEMGNTIMEEQVLDPICDLNMGPDPENNPKWVFTVEPERNRKEEADVIDLARNQIRIPLKASEVYNRLGLSQPEPGDEDVLLPPATPPQSVTSEPTPFKAVSPLERIVMKGRR
jgi:phage gp29-like protein